MEVATEELWARFGFNSNPFDHEPLLGGSSVDMYRSYLRSALKFPERFLVDLQRSEEVFFGREIDDARLTAVLGSNSKLALVSGETGVGKTSLVNMVIGRLAAKGLKPGGRLILPLRPVVGNSESDATSMQRRFYQGVLKALRDKNYAALLARELSAPTDQVPTPPDPREVADVEDLRVMCFDVLEELAEQCEDVLFVGGFEDLENVKRSEVVEELVEVMRRDEQMPCLSIFFCGARGILERTMNESKTSAYTRAIQIDPLRSADVAQSIDRRIQSAGARDALDRAPVDGRTFTLLYAVHNHDMREAHTTAEDFCLSFLDRAGGRGAEIEPLDRYLRSEGERARKRHDLGEGPLEALAAFVRSGRRTLERWQLEDYLDKLGIDNGCVRRLVAANLIKDWPNPEDDLMTRYNVTRTGHLVDYALRATEPVARQDEDGEYRFFPSWRD